MSKQREAFEAYWQEKWEPVLARMPGAMGLAFREMAEHAWQASRAAALEECQSLADRVKRELQEDSKPGGYFDAGGQGAGVVADAIRALKEQS